MDDPPGLFEFETVLIYSLDEACVVRVRDTLQKRGVGSWSRIVGRRFTGNSNRRRTSIEAGACDGIRTRGGGLVPRG